MLASVPRAEAEVGGSQDLGRPGGDRGWLGEAGNC